jgi:hypothetical protein
MIILSQQNSAGFLKLNANVLAMFSVGFAEIVKLPKTLISQLKYSRC